MSVKEMVKLISFMVGILRFLTFWQISVIGLYFITSQPIPTKAIEAALIFSAGWFIDAVILNKMCEINKVDVNGNPIIKEDDGPV